ncbi:MAG: hypothetical protein KJ850_06655 [Gammaproteobacteria bacterium]|nr:hypothetical protein [Gammaproteobacteria bacterium]MBU1624717.1 hypothetical protein [Gammaproteobacteria bacterium]MBU1982561.1 hypothetical protein [Gammaproteobacteria bacterium]
MSDPLLLLIVILKALVEVAALSLLAQGVLRILAGRNFQQNFAYRLFQVIASPAISLARWVSPSFIAQQYLGLVALLLLFWMWLALIYAKAYVCHAHQLSCFSA